MSTRRSMALVVHEVRILSHDPLPFILSVILPLVMMSFLRPAFDAMFATTGGGTGGAAQAVPGMAVLYATFLVSNISYGFLREFDWRTWTRLRLSGASVGELVVSKLVPGFVVVFALMALLIAAGGVLFGLEISGSTVALVALLALFSAWLTAAGALVASVCRTAAQATAIANLVALGFGGVSGFLVPAETLPTWAERLGRPLPTRAVMDGLRDVVAGASLPDITSDAVVLAAWTAVTVAVAVATLRRAVDLEERR